MTQKRYSRQCQRFAKFAVLAVCMLIGMAAQVRASVEKEHPLRVLFIGNSFTYFNDMPDMIVELTRRAATGHRLEFGAIAENGASLESHWANKQTRKIIHTGNWNYVVLQENSNVALNRPKRMAQFVRKFASLTKEDSVKIILFSTPTYKARLASQEQMSENVMKCAAEHNAAIVLGGTAVKKAVTQLPDLEFYADDHVHPNKLGSRLIALLFYYAFFNDLPKPSVAFEGVATSVEITKLHGLIVDVIKAKVAR